MPTASADVLGRGGQQEYVVVVVRSRDSPLLLTFSMRGLKLRNGGDKIGAASPAAATTTITTVNPSAYLSVESLFSDLSFLFSLLHTHMDKLL